MSSRSTDPSVSLLVVALLAATAPPALGDHPAVSLGGGAGRGINTESGVPLPRGAWSIGARSEYVDFRAYSDARLRALRRRGPEADLHSVDALLAVTLGVFYGLTDDVTVGLRLPYVRRTGIREPTGGDPAATAAAHSTGGGGGGGTGIGIERPGAIDGLGDLGLFGQWRVFERAPWHGSLLAGLDLPTGETSARASNGERLETEFQPGSGAVDGSLGFAVTRTSRWLSADASAVYTIAGRGARKTDLGDVFAYGIAVAHRLGAHGGEAGHDHDHGHRLLWDAFVELNGEWRARERVGGETDANSGGTLLWLSPGARLTVGGRLTIGVSVGIPIAEGLHGDQVRPSWRLVTSAGLAF